MIARARCTTLRLFAAFATLLGLSWGGAALAAITEVAATVAGSSTGTATSLSVNLPAGTTANDFMLLQVTARNQTETITPPSGWTAIRADTQAYLGIGITQALYYRVATASEPASYSFSVSTGSGLAASIVTLRGVSTTAPIFAHIAQSGAGLTATAPAVANCQAGAVQVGFFGFSTALLNLTLGGGLTSFSGTTTNSLAGLTIAAAGEQLVTAGTCPALTAVAVSLTANIGQQVVLTPAPPTYAVSGSVYGDANHDGTLTGGETGIGQATYVKLASGSPGACTSPALQVATADPTTGAYSFSAVAAGSYCLVASTNTTLTDVTTTTPSGFLRTETSSGVRSLTVSAAAVTGQNFGLYAGSTVSGRVFTDTGTGGGTANDGVQNGTEAGVASATVTAMSGASTVTTATTDATGAYTAWIPSTASGTIAIVGTLPASTLATGGSAGTTGGTYTRTSNTTAFTFASGNAYTGVNFGDVPVSVFTPNNALTTGPGATAPYAHSFVAGSAGQLTFTTSAVSTPSAAWTQSIILDANCNGVADAGETAVSGAITVTAGQTVCIVVKDTSPAAATAGAQDVVTVTATLVYTGASPALSVASTRTDTTTISTSILLQLAKQVRNVTQGTTFVTSNTALPNEVIEYQVTATNPATTAVSTIVINDVTPTFTTFVSAACPSPLPSGISACAVTAQPAVGGTGALQWTFTGSLPASGAVAMTYQVRVNP